MRRAVAIVVACVCALMAGPAALAGTNLITNGSFEGAGNGSLAGWKSQSSTLSLVPGDGGGFGARALWNGSTTSYGIATKPNPVAGTASAGTLYTAAGRFDAPTGKSVCLRVKETGAQPKTTTACTAGAGAWKDLPQIPYTALADGDSLAVIVIQKAPVAGDAFVVDNLSLVAASGGTIGPPANLTAAAVSGSEIDLQWTASPTSGITGYHVYRNGGSQPVGTVSAPETTFADTGLAPTTTYAYTVTAFDATRESAPSNQASATTTSSGTGSPIRHVVVVVMENRTFDNVLGRLCANEGGRCDGATTGKMPDGTVVPLVAEPDLRPDVNHSHESQVKAIDGGRMDGFMNVPGCNTTDSPCLSEFMGTAGSQVPNVWSLADTYAISDRTFEPFTSSSWVGHMELGAATHESWHGNNPQPSATHAAGPGWGCNSFNDAPWDLAGGSTELLPSCIPDSAGAGPYRSTDATYTQTIMDRLDGAGLSWRIYVNNVNSAWSICATFWECYGTSQQSNVVKPTVLTTDAQNGTLPSLAYVIPQNFNSMHPSFSALDGDNWLASVVNPVLHGPEASSTAIFVVWDDCACLYDHVNPLQYSAAWGPRVPLLILSPWAKPHYVDHTPTSFGSILAFVESTFGLAPLAEEDAGAYAYANAFDFTQVPVVPPTLTSHAVAHAERVWLRNHPHHVDDVLD